MKHLVVGGVLVRDNRALLVYRSPHRGWYPNVWDLPGGHVVPGEHPQAALVRELRGELAIDADVTGPPIARTVADDFVMDVWAIRAWSGEPTNSQPEEHNAIDWLTPEHLHRLAVAHPDVPDQVLLALNP